MKTKLFCLSERSLLNKAHLFFTILFLTIAYHSIGQFQLGTYAIHEVNVIDVKHKQIIENQTIVVEGERITGIFNSNEFNHSDSIHVLNFRGHFVVPGLIDAHVHLGTSPSKDDKFERTKERLNYLLRNGVTTVRDMAGDARYLSYLSRQASLDEIPSPDIYFSALLAGQSFFKDPRTEVAAQGIASGEAPWMHAINTNSDLNQIIAEAKGTGATGVKIYADLDKNHVQRIVQAAHLQGLEVWAHSTVFPARPSEVCQAGVDVMSHATYMAWEGEKEIPSDASNRFRKHKDFDIDNPAFLSLMKEMKKNQTILDATIVVYSDSTLYEYGIALTKLAYENGVKIGVGTDVNLSDLTMGAPIFKEMAAMQKDVGMKPIDIIRAATMINAEMIGKEQEIGSVEMGKKANLLVLRKNPIKDINNIASQVLVIKNGHLFNTD